MIILVYLNLDLFVALAVMIAFYSLLPKLTAEMCRHGEFEVGQGKKTSN